ncbi:cap-specific mRNA (nucleoside-2'-O-)-methyltransferase 1 [Anopheles nili]|uniref:cap-specific mRNA (nucleoside-2'-O-)-methyltransferase 1 n=1 Tax=Anopheles nili TaxID=185578 RepID=UPI00237B9B80|nr:cap-specific mRNA (nucleoside-2'-O-)-methyltransferase 1 [Anopheles nili]
MASTSNLSEDSSEKQSMPQDTHEKGKRKHVDDGHSDPTDKKKPNLEETGESAQPNSFQQFSEKSFRMMQQMGYKIGTGLGKTGQGRVDLIETSSQKGRSGLGMKLNELETAADQWDASIENLQIPEIVTWLQNASADMEDPGITREQLDAWVKEGPRKLTIDDEHKYCDSNILHHILESKSVFDNLGADDMRKARSKSNPFELIKSNIFINRAAVKMANMDAMFDFMFTKPVDRKSIPLVKDDDLFYFADVCAGPGGFSEYVLWRKKWRAKGFGFTLRGGNDFRLDDFSAGAPETFDPYYGPKDDGNVFDPVNIEGFTDYVMKQTESGVHLMMADGGFSVEGQENVQEILSKQLYLCQMIVALAIVRTDGHFVVKLFDLFTPFSAGLIYLVYKCFRQISICKPNSSRPANSERYLVCKWKLPNTDQIQRHLEDINRQMFTRNRTDKTDTLELVPEEVLREDTAFFEYLCNSNNTIGRNQITALLKIAAFCKNRDLAETCQLEMKQKCLKLWQLPDTIRKFSNKGDPDKYVEKFYKEWEGLKNELCHPEKMLIPELKACFRSTHDWYFVPIGNLENNGKNIRMILLGKGGKEVYQYDGKQNSWSPLKDIAIELPPGTIIYAEIVRELQGEGKSQITINTLHIIDGLVLGEEDIRMLPLTQRIVRCTQFAKALNKPLKGASNDCNNRTATIQIRAKKLYRFYEMESFFNSLETYKLKSGDAKLGYCVRNPIDANRIYIPYGLLFLREIKPDYLKLVSKSTNKFYYHCSSTRASFYPHEFKNFELQTMATFEQTFLTRQLWSWKTLPQVQPEYDGERFPEYVYRVDFKPLLPPIN